MIYRTISRRRVFALASAAAMACLSLFRSTVRGQSQDRATAINKELITFCSGLGCPKAISKAALLALTPDERELSRLLKTVGDASKASQSGPASRGTLAQSIRDTSRYDFKKGRILIVNGWILSITEARIYALAALLLQQS